MWKVQVEESGARGEVVCKVNYYVDNSRNRKSTMFLLYATSEYNSIIVRDEDYEEGRKGRKKMWVDFETATKMLGKGEYLTILNEAMDIIETQRDKIIAIKYKQE